MSEFYPLLHVVLRHYELTKEPSVSYAQLKAERIPHFSATLKEALEIRLLQSEGSRISIRSKLVFRVAFDLYRKSPSTQHHQIPRTASALKVEVVR